MQPLHESSARIVTMSLGVLDEAFESSNPGWEAGRAHLWSPRNWAPGHPVPSREAKIRLGDHDALLGFGLIAAYCVVALVAMLLFPVGHVRSGSAASIVGVTLAIDSVLLALIGGRLKGPILLCFPILLIASELALSLLVPGGEAAEFTGFLTLMFVFIGLTQGRGVGPVFVVITGVAWAIIQRPWTAQVGVKLFLRAGHLAPHVSGPRRPDGTSTDPHQAARHAGQYRRLDRTRKSALSLGPHRAHRGGGGRPRLGPPLHRP